MGLSLFAIQFLWQMPHFFAIAWMFTEDYARAGFMVHSSGVNTGRQIILYCCALIPVSLLPTLFGATGDGICWERCFWVSFTWATALPWRCFVPTLTHSGC